MQTKRSDNFMSAFYPQKMQGGGKPKKPTKRVFFAVAEEGTYRGINLIGQNDANLGSFDEDLAYTSFENVNKEVNNFLKKAPINAEAFDKWYEENKERYSHLPSKESAKQFFIEDFADRVAGEIYDKAQIIQYDTGQIMKPSALQDVLSEIKDKYSLDLSGIKNLKNLYGSMSGFDYLANNNFNDNFKLKETQEKYVDDTFIKEAKQASKISMATEGVPSEIVVISNDEDFKTKIPEVLKSNKGKNVEFGLLTHAGNFLGVSRKDVNALFSENMEEGCKLGLYSCYGLSQARSTFPGVKSLTHNMGTTWKGFPRFRTEQEYKNLAGKSFGEVAYGIGKNLNYSGAKHGRDWVDTSKFATEEERANFYKEQIRTQAEEEALRTLRRQAREAGVERPDALPSGFDLSPYILDIERRFSPEFVSSPELISDVQQSTISQQIPVIQTPLEPAPSRPLQQLTIPRRFQSGGAPGNPAGSFLNLLNSPNFNIPSAFQAFGQAGTQYGNLFNTGAANNPFAYKQDMKRWEDLSGEEQQTQKKKLADEMGLKTGWAGGDWSNDKGEIYTNDQLLNMAKDKYSTQQTSTESWNKTAPFASLAYASMNLQDMENQELLNKKEKIQDYPVTKSTYAPKGFARQGGLMSQLIGTYGYRDDSPFRNASSLTIPGNNIDMSKTGKNLMLIPDKGEPVFARRYSGTYQFPKNVKSVLEVPMNMQNGGNLNVPKFQNSGYVPPVGKSVVDLQVTDDTTWKKQDSKAKQTQKNINKNAKQIIANKKPSEYTEQEAAIIERSTLPNTLKYVDQYKIAKSNEARARGEFSSPENFAEANSAIGSKLSLQQLPLIGSRIPDWVERNLNPFRSIGDAASGLGQVPKNIKESDYGKAALNVGLPLITGALAGMGAGNTRQFVNQLVNPAAGLGSAIIPAAKSTGNALVQGGRFVKTIPYRYANTAFDAKSYISTPSKEDFLLKSKNLAKIDDIMNPSKDLGKEAFERQKMESLQFWNTPEGRRRIQKHLDEDVNPLFRANPQDRSMDYTPNMFIYDLERTKYVPKAESTQKEEILSKVVKDYRKVNREREKLNKIMYSNDLSKLSKEKQLDLVEKGTKLAERETSLLTELNKMRHFSGNNAYYSPFDYKIGLGRYYNTPESASEAVAHEWGHAKSASVYPRVIDLFTQSAAADRPLNIRARSVLGPNNWSFMDNAELQAQPHLRQPTSKEVSRNFRGMKSPYSEDSISSFLNPGQVAVRSRNYFLSGDEPYGFLGETLDYLKRQNFIKNQADKIDINILDDAINKYRSNKNIKSPVRIFDFINKDLDKGQLQYLADELNDFVYQDQNQKDPNMQYAKQGGIISNNRYIPPVPKPF